MSDDTAVLYGITYDFDGGFSAVVVPTADDQLSPLSLRARLFAHSMFYQQQRVLNGFRACVVAISDGTTIPPWCKHTELELLGDTDGNKLLDGLFSIDPEELPP